jgi:hypothetical protein
MLKVGNSLLHTGEFIFELTNLMIAVNNAIILRRTVVS